MRKCQTQHEIEHLSLVFQWFVLTCPIIQPLCFALLTSMLPHFTEEL